MRGFKRNATHSQFQQDRFLDAEVFRGRRGGTFFEAGAFDGVTGSNTVFFERHRGWTGVLAEASPTLAARAVARRASPCLPVALGAAEGTASFLEVQAGYRMMGGLLDSYPPALLARVRANETHRESLLEVPTVPLQVVLEQAGLLHVDLVSLDIEGGEMAVLSAFPFERFSVGAWCIENFARDPALGELMGANGYRRLARLGVDEIFVPAAGAEHAHA